MSGRLRSLLRLLGMALVLGVSGSSDPAPAQRSFPTPPKLAVPYEPTPHRIVEVMLRLADVAPTDYLVDLGCGDGRIPITAAERFGVKALCIDLDPARIRDARANAKLAKVEDKVEIVEGDLFQADLSRADVLTLYLWPEVNLRLRERILDLKPGTRIVSHEHDMGAWRPEETRRMGRNVVYLWRVPAKIAGPWTLTVDGKPQDIAVDQRYQTFTARAAGSRQLQTIRNGRIDGRKVDFLFADAAGKTRRLKGEVGDSGTLSGEGWQAARRP